MNYNLKTIQQTKTSMAGALRKMLPLLADEKFKIFLAFIAIILNVGLNLMAPLIFGYTIDTYVQTKQYQGIFNSAVILLAIYLVAFVASYLQTRLMGGIAQRVLFKLRNNIFQKLQSLPVAFFNQNKAGDLISRMNNDTDKLNQFFSQSLMQFVATFFTMAGAAIFILSINTQLGIAALGPAFVIIVFTRLISAWVKQRNFLSLQSTGGLSSEIQESLQNFKVIVAFNRHDYVREKFQEVNQQNFSAAIRAGFANNIFTPVYDFCSNMAQLTIFCYGIYLISNGHLSVGLLISFLMYAGRFYDPVRHLAALWSSLQLALAAWDRISQVMDFSSDMKILDPAQRDKPEILDPSSKPLMEFKQVSFHYPDGERVLKNINFELLPGKTYALVGPTGGGKTTTASLMARLYDPSEGQIFLEGKDIRSYQDSARTHKIGFILQEPFLFSGTVRDNILYGNENFLAYSDDQLNQELKKANLEKLLARFDQGLATVVTNNSENISLGQKQLIAFMRAVLRNPKLLILDEATANIDTVTEQLLDEILQKLPKSTTRVIIAHRLNTIENADEIFFVNSGEITRAGSVQHAMEMLIKGKRAS